MDTTVLIYIFIYLFIYFRYGYKMLISLWFLLYFSLLLQTLDYPSEKHESKPLIDNYKGIHWSDKNTTETRVFIDNSPGLINLCIFFNVSLSECSCSIIPELCKVLNFIRTSNEYNVSHTYIRSKTYTLIYTSVTVVASLFGVIGNVAVILVSFKQRHDLSSCKLHIAELAFVNFIFSVVQMINAIPLYWTNRWIYSLPMCKIIRTVLEIGSFLTICLILLISIERYILIVHPLDSLFVEGIIKHISVLINIAVVIATVVPYFIGLNIEMNSGRCVMFQGKSRYMYLPYNCFVVAFYFIIPICIMLFAYGKIIRSLSKQEFNDSLNKGKLILKRMRINHKIVRVTLSLLGVFIVCTLPTRMIMIYMEMVGFTVENMNLYFTLVFVGYVTYPLQSTLNPILYSMVDHEWRKGMRTTLTSIRKKLLCTNSNDDIINNTTRQVRTRLFLEENIQEIDL